MRRVWLMMALLGTIPLLSLAQDPIADVDALEPAVNTSLGRVDLAPAVPPPAAAQVPADDARDAAPAPPVAGGSKTTGGYRAMDQLDLGTTSITGNQELPKVLYIIPWKNSDLGDLVGRPVNTLLDEVLAPVDPEVFRRQLDYYDTLYGESQEE